MPPGSVQHCGANVMALVETLGSAPELADAAATAHLEDVYFDFLGLFVVIYSQREGASRPVLCGARS